MKLNFLPQESSWLTFSKGRLSKIAGQIIWTASKVNRNYIKKTTPSCQQQLPFHLLHFFLILLSRCLLILSLSSGKGTQSSDTQLWSVTLLDELGTEPEKLEKYCFSGYALFLFLFLFRCAFFFFKQNYSSKVPSIYWSFVVFWFILVWTASTEQLLRLLQCHLLIGRKCRLILKAKNLKCSTF